MEGRITWGPRRVDAYSIYQKWVFKGPHGGALRLRVIYINSSILRNGMRLPFLKAGFLISQCNDLLSSCSLFNIFSAAASTQTSRRRCYFNWVTVVIRLKGSFKTAVKFGLNPHRAFLSNKRSYCCVPFVPLA